MTTEIVSSLRKSMGFFASCLEHHDDNARRAGSFVTFHLLKGFDEHFICEKWRSTNDWRSESASGSEFSSHGNSILCLWFHVLRRGLGLGRADILVTNKEFILCQTVFSWYYLHILEMIAQVSTESGCSSYAIRKSLGGCPFSWTVCYQWSSHGYQQTSEFWCPCNASHKSTTS